MDQKTANRIKGACAALPCFIVAITFLRTWVDPMSVSDGRWISYAVGIIALEFVLVHSGFMLAFYMGAGSGGRVGLSVVMTLVYALFAAIIALCFKSWSLFIIFTMVMATRWSSFILDPKNAKKEAAFRSTVTMAIYMLVFPVAMLLPLPQLGVTPELMREIHPDLDLGDMNAEPHVLLAVCVIYFSTLGLLEFFIFSKVGDEKEGPAAGQNQ